MCTCQSQTLNLFLLSTLPHPGVETDSPALQVDSLPAELQINVFDLLYSVSANLGFSSGLKTAFVIVQPTCPGGC